MTVLIYFDSASMTQCPFELLHWGRSSVSRSKMRWVELSKKIAKNTEIWSVVGKWSNARPARHTGCSVDHRHLRCYAVCTVMWCCAVVSLLGWASALDNLQLKCDVDKELIMNIGRVRSSALAELWRPCRAVASSCAVEVQSKVQSTT